MALRAGKGDGLGAGATVTAELAFVDDEWAAAFGACKRVVAVAAGKVMRNAFAIVDAHHMLAECQGFLDRFQRGGHEHGVGGDRWVNHG